MQFGNLELMHKSMSGRLSTGNSQDHRSGISATGRPALLFQNVALLFLFSHCGCMSQPQTYGLIQSLLSPYRTTVPWNPICRKHGTQSSRVTGLAEPVSISKRHDKQRLEPVRLNDYTNSSFTNYSTSCRHTETRYLPPITQISS